MASESRKRPAPAPALAPKPPADSQVSRPKRGYWTAEELLEGKRRAASSLLPIANPPNTSLRQGQPTNKRVKQAIPTRVWPANPPQKRSSLSNRERSPELGDAQPGPSNNQRSPELGDPERLVRTALCKNNSKPSQPTNTTATPISNIHPSPELDPVKLNAMLKEFHKFQKELHAFHLIPLPFISFFYFHIAQYLDSADIVNLSSISSTFDAAERQADHWDIDLALNDFFGHSQHNFRKVLRQTHSFVAGPFALRYFSHCDDYRVPMDVFVKREKSWSHLRHYLVEGQHFRKVGEDEALRQDPSINRVHLYQHAESNLIIRVFTTVSTPINALLRSATDTSMLNVITSDRAYCLFPRATIISHELYHLRRPKLHSHQSPASLSHAAWKWEGDAISTQSIQGRKEFGKEFTDDRHIGDKHTWTIEFDHGVADQDNGRQSVIEDIENTAFEIFQERPPERLTAPSASRNVPRGSREFMSSESDRETELGSVADGCEADYRIAEFNLRKRKVAIQCMSMDGESSSQAGPGKPAPKPAMVDPASESDAESVVFGSQLDHQRAEAARKQIGRRAPRSGQSTGKPSSSAAARPAAPQRAMTKSQGMNGESSRSAAATFAHLSIVVRRDATRSNQGSGKPSTSAAFSTQPAMSDTDTDSETESVVETGELPHMLAEAGQRVVTRSSQMNAESSSTAASQLPVPLSGEQYLGKLSADFFAEGMLRMMPQRLWDFTQKCLREQREREGVLPLSDSRQQN